MNYYLQAESEEALWKALEDAGVAKNIALPYPIEVTDSALEQALDQLPLDDAINSHTVEYEGETYMADAGKWYKLVPRYLQRGDGYDPDISKHFQIAQGVDLDIIGTIFKPTGRMIQMVEGECPETAAIPGYHANIRGITEEQAALLPTIAKPSSPVRIWAGD
jgi:hypothetical protein